MKKVTKFGVVLTLGSAGLLAFLGRWEGNVNTVYADKLAAGLPTVCKGITKHVSPYPVVVGDYWSPERCDEVERMVTERTQLKLLDCFKVPINQSQFDAFTSHAHNFGVASTCASRAVGLTNAGRAMAGCDALSHAPDGRPVWSYVKGKDGKPVFVRGLYNRRKAETALCRRGFT
jgi:GH24 family phage-related lysozyme (muramidase)